MRIKDYFKNNLFAGKTVFVTGGAGTINRGIAAGFGALGARIVLGGRTEKTLEEAAETVRRAGGEVMPITLDVEDFSSLKSAFELSAKTFGPVDVLICGAAGNFPCPAEQMSAEGFAKVISIDLNGSFNASRAAFSQLKQTRGNIVCVSATNAIMPFVFQCHVGAAKAGIDSLMRGLALEWGRFGIRCNSILPGPIKETEGLSRLLTAEDISTLEPYVPIGRFGTVEDVAEAAVFLASPAASLITGATLVLDGGQSFSGSAMLAEIMQNG